ncbi:hypothetical protein SAMN04488029_1629 [Reichenbachiella faecimaris]|uniref:Lipoprotein n=1 Tax=Reichenbachiella faecimaris TaxID=692418 RepID=A0A1W2GAN1_REIFA|nr:hypothetical protein [Reichenbachiella faecimaris]SMD33725.1 hypothetical protein SAMN04488029_1629 [Reichenbachiella faecimaris]
MKKLLALLFVFTSMGLMVSCDDDDDEIEKTVEELQQEAVDAAAVAVAAVVSSDETATGASDESVFDDWTLVDQAGQTGGRVRDIAEEIEVTANIEQDTEWTSDNIYVLKTRVTVLDGATLTIEAGTVVKGDASLSGANAAVLMIAKGGKLMAEGTATAPIIMTSTDDDIQPGEIAGSELDQDDKGRWGGLVILGKAPVSAKTENPQIEGVDAEDSNGQYGGSDAADNSGVIKYVSIRHGGAEIAEGSEINGLTLGGVGTGTVIENIEVYANSDDGVEFFGGTVNVTNLLVYAVGDDAIDIDQSYAGTVSNFVVYVDENSDEGLEIDGREGSLDKSFTLMNGSINSIDGTNTNADFKSKAKGSVTNVVFEDGKVKLSASFDSETYQESEDAALNVVNESLTFSKVSVSSFEVYTTSFDE